ncbi:MAG: hypothetical protein QM529_07420, partial [Hydrotalea sp.]|nr:hypothetical protein [Hydrotalea sp.]
VGSLATFFYEKTFVDLPCETRPQDREIMSEHCERIYFSGRLDTSSDSQLASNLTENYSRKINFTP